MIRHYKKFSYDELSSDTFARQQYMSNLRLENAPIRFRIASKLVPTIRKNHSSKYRRMGQPLTCPMCTHLNLPLSSSSVAAVPVETERNDCIAVSDLRSECEPSDDNSLAEFVRKVVARHMELEEEMSQ